MIGGGGGKEDPERTAGPNATAYLADLLEQPQHQQQRRQVAAALFGKPIDAVTVGPYRLGERLGEGGMGTIHAATRERGDAGGEEVAIKLVNPLEADTGRFEREIGILARIVHPRIVRYIDHGVTADGRAYLVMERLHGEDLRAHLRRRRPGVGECVALGIQVAEALEAAHALGCVHRDIKPSNVFLLDGALASVKVLDFGLARANGVMPSMTNTGTVLGTIGYMAPEQARGDAGLDHRADIFSLGCVLYEALTGELPFPGEHAVAILAKILIDEPRPLTSLRPDAPPGLARVIHAMLGKRAEDRPGSARELIAALRACEEVERSSDAAVEVPVVSYREQRAICLLLVGGPLGPVDVADTTTALAGTLAELARRHGAAIISVVDGSELLVFDLTEHLRDAIARAARCALDIRSQRSDVAQALCVGKAEHSGGSVVGHVIDRASLLLRDAGPGTIVVDESCAQTLAPSFELESLGDHARLLGDPDPLALATLLGKPSPFIGRARELGALTGLFEQVVEETRACAAVIVAAPGFGKTRLWREATQAFARGGHDPLIFVIQGLTALRDSPLAALRAALLREAGVVGADSPARARERVLARYAAVDQGRAVLIAQLCCVPVDDESDELLTLARRDPLAHADMQRLAWLDWLRAEAGRRPVVLVVDDLQWCDELTAEFVRAAIDDLADHPLLSIATAHPEVAARFALPWPGPDAELVELAPISARASEMLVRRAVEVVEPDRVAALVARAEGNPFVLEELVRSLSLDSAAIPDTVLSLVQARLVRLDDEHRRLLRAASVFDGAFDPRGVARLLGRSHADIVALIEQLVHEELLAAEPGGDGNYRFRHALVRDAAHAMLSDVDRGAAHRAAAEWLASVGQDRADRAEIAAHFERGDDRRAAAEWWVRAARRAMLCADVKATAGYAERALACEVEGALLAEVRVLQAEVALWSGDVSTAADLARAGLEHAEPGTVVWFGALRRAIACAYLRLRMDEARELIARLEPFAGLLGSDAYLFCVAEATYTLCVAGAIDEARTLAAKLEQLDPLDQAAISVPVRAAIHHSRSALAGHERRQWVCLIELERAIACHDEAGDITSAARARATLAWMFMTFGAPERVEQVIGEALPTARRLAARHARLYFETLLAFANIRRGLTEAPHALLEQLAERARATGERRLLGYIRITAANVLHEPIPSSETVARIRATLADLRPVASSHLWASATLAMLLMRRDELDEALELARTGVARLYRFASVLDDEFAVWARFIAVFDRAGEREQAELALAEALRRVELVCAQIEDEPLRASLLAHEPVVWLRRRADPRGRP